MLGLSERDGGALSWGGGRALSWGGSRALSWGGGRTLSGKPTPQPPFEEQDEKRRKNCGRATEDRDQHLMGLDTRGGGRRSRRG